MYTDDIFGSDRSPRSGNLGSSCVCVCVSGTLLILAIREGLKRGLEEKA